MNSIKMPLHLSEALKADCLTEEEHKAAMLQLQYALYKEMCRSSRALYDHRHPVEETQWGNTIPPNGITITPQYEGTARIESILYMLPVGTTSAVLQLDQNIYPLYGGQTIDNVLTAPVIGSLHNLGVMLDRMNRRALTITTNSSVPTSNTSQADSAFTAAGGAASLPTAATRLTGFDVTWGAATTAQAVTVTVSNVTGGNMAYTIYEAVGAGGSLSIRYPGNGILETGGQATVTVAAATGGSSGNIAVYGNNSLSVTSTPFFIGLYGHAFERFGEH